MGKTEAETRRELIDQKLRLAGWNVSDPSQVAQELDIDLIGAGLFKEEPKTKYSGHQFADYALIQHGKPIAVVEAKKASVSAQLGQEQALQYAQNLQHIHGGPIPFIFYTNGYDVYCWEPDFYPPVQVPGFPTYDDLEWMQQRREARKPLSVELIDTDIAGRGYQIAAIRSILEGVEAKRTKFLLVMATGTGKTRTATALLDVLMRARWAKRVLFLVDRIALRDQALDAFREHIPSEPRWPEKEDQGFVTERRVYVTTYPTMLNLIQHDTTPQDWISPHFFDVVIADESHRSIYNTYKQVLDYFHAIKLGLTATPRDHIDHDTFQLFDCGAHDPTYGYTFEEAIAHDPPYLSDFEVLKVRSKFQLEGIKGDQLPPALQKQLIAEGKDLDEIDFEGTDLEKKVTNSGTNALIVREFMEECIKDESGTLPGKTIFFAISKGHARRLAEMFDHLYPEYQGKLARVLVSEDRFVHGKGGLLDQFKTQDFPRVAISVDMLDTGVDVPEVVNLVFAKPVYSYVKFWQMIGRGTRVLPSIPKPWCKEKDRFLIIDCWGNFEYFQIEPKGREPGEQVPLPVRLFKMRLDQLEAARQTGQEEVVATVIEELRADLAALPKNNVVVAEGQAHLDQVQPDSFWQGLTDADLSFLRSTIAPLLRARSDADFKAMRFTTNGVELRTVLLLNRQEAFDTIREEIVQQVAELPLTVNLVGQERILIEAVQANAWWVGIRDEKLRDTVERLAPLMRFRQQRKDPMMILDLTDLVQVKEWVEVGPHQERVSVSAYQERVEAHVRELLQSNPVLQKIQQGTTITDDEIHQLSRLLREQDPYLTEDLLHQVYDHKAASFMQFIRHILGLETLEKWSETVTRQFDEFLAQHNTYSQLQIRFLQTLCTYVLQRGKLEKADLLHAPFTQIHPNGVRGVFPTQEIDEILTFARQLVA